MKTLMIAGKLNDSVKDLNAYLSRWYKVQISSENEQVFASMLKVVHPDLVIISLIGLYDGSRALFDIMQDQYAQIPVLTIGTEGESRRFDFFYNSEQFKNLIRPIDDQSVEEAVVDRLGLDPITRRSPGAKEKKHVLVVDDNAAMLRSIKAMLDEEFDVQVAPSGMKAMTLIGRKKPDLILLDYEMPVCDGRQTLEMIRSEEDIADIPVIFLTGVNDREHISAVLALKPSGYMLKPAVKEKLVEAIHKAIG